MPLTRQQAEDFARMPLTYLRQEYPNHIMHLLNGAQDIQSPRELHPIFYGCFDWHSAVHGYWLLLRCLRHFPTLSCRDAIAALFEQHFTRPGALRERDYFQAPFRASFERPYGYGWLLALDQELAASAFPGAARWREALQPLTGDIRERLINYLDKLSYPVRVGTHFNTAFALILAMDHARSMRDRALEQAIAAAAAGYYQADTDYPAHYEPAGDDYLSGALTEALLMSKLLGREFAPWFDKFLPGIERITPLLQPARVSDRTDPKIAHLDGLNLSRAWCLRRIGQCLPQKHPAQPCLREATERHLSASVPHVVGSHYSGGHWLASFAMLALEE
ncbi:DUF2891 domain-containing protein [Martelella alba]|uniref:DUF2891 domain-containing protein n=1 Tax=Martelella alba TaxID=2590451 RepID=A0ABY2SMT6_9HYPH|nr:DUF2891 domain-containing protein [Martelella alba]TKI06982.1 DUF2891 domain-containing protein [Martelella alba]